MKTQQQGPRTGARVAPVASAPPGLLQRKCACGVVAGLDGECSGCQANRLNLQRKAAHQVAPSEAPSIVQNVLRSPGQPLDGEPLSLMRSRLGHDFSHVRVHTDARAGESAQAVGALAYTVGQHLVFGAGQYEPSTRAGRRLLAHELTHTLQQEDIRQSSWNVQIGHPLDRHLEREADQTAAAAMGESHQSGPPVVTGLDSLPGAIIQRQSIPASTTPTTSSSSWTIEELKSIQRELIRLGLYNLSVDGDLGAGTDSGLVEAFGGDEWRTLPAAAVLARLKDAKPHPGGKKGEHEFRYGEMFKDGLLDMTLAIGFDEGGNQPKALEKFVAAMTLQRFAMDKNLAEKVYKKAGRTLGPSAFGAFFVRENALSYKPPAGPARMISAVVRLVFSLDGSQGKEVASAFKEGMVNSDVAYYSGHGRHGSGPDFDRNFMLTLLAADGTIEQKVADYDVLEEMLTNEGAAHKRDAWSQFMWRVNNHRIDVTSVNKGNIVLNTKNLHSGSFGAKLMYWNLNRTGGKGSAEVTGKAGELAKSAEATPERKYRVVVFDGCRSLDYRKSLRATPGFDTKSADMLLSSVLLNWGDEGPTLAEFLNSIIAMQSAEEIARNMNAQQGDVKKGLVRSAYLADGLDDNPVIK